MKWKPGNNEQITVVAPEIAVTLHADTTDTVPATDKPLQPLTNKQKTFVANIINKGMNKTEAYIDAYDHNGLRKTANEEASRTARQPSVKLELSKYSGEAENTMIELMRISKDYAQEGGKDGASYAAVGVAASRDILDRVHGKATQRTEVKTEAVVINIDLTSAT